MRRCPECNSFFPDTDQFCEHDGTPLETVAPPQLASKPGLLPIVAVAGVVLGALLFLVYFSITRKAKQESPPTSNPSAAQRQLPVRVLPPPPLATPSPSVEPSPSPTVEPSPSPQSTTERVELSSNPISTAAGSQGKSGPVTIRLDSGVTIEADEAWQTVEGIWYRRRGVVSLLEPKHVKAIEKPKPPTPQPSASSTPPAP